VFEIYGVLPSYRAMLDREGAQGPGDVAIVGDEIAVRAQLERLAEIGVTVRNSRRASRHPSGASGSQLTGAALSRRERSDGAARFAMLAKEFGGE